MDYTRILTTNLNNSIQNKQRLLADKAQLGLFSKAVELVVDAFRTGGCLFIAGNGGSAADAQHLAAEFVSKLAKPRAPLPAESLTTDTSILTAIGNDFGYEFVFSRQIEGKAKRGDIFLAITTSGKSPNIIQALRKCRELGVYSILLSGRDGGDARHFADITLLGQGETTSSIQEVHQVLYHSLCEAVEAALFDSDRLGEVSGFVHVGSALQGDVVSKELERDTH